MSRRCLRVGCAWGVQYMGLVVAEEDVVVAVMAEEAPGDAVCAYIHVRLAGAIEPTDANRRTWTSEKPSTHPAPYAPNLSLHPMDCHRLTSTSTRACNSWRRPRSRRRTLGLPPIPLFPFSLFSTLCSAPNLLLSSLVFSPLPSPFSPSPLSLRAQHYIIMHRVHLSHTQTHNAHQEKDVLHHVLLCRLLDAR